MTTKPSAKRVKAGTSKEAAAARRIAFAHAYIANGRNGTQAAIEAGFSKNGAEAVAARLLRDIKVQAIVERAVEAAAAASGLTVERTLRELARIAYADPGTAFENEVKMSAADKISALDKAMKHQGLYEKDNTQQVDNIRVIVELV